MKMFTLIFHTIETDHPIYYQVNTYLPVELLILLNKVSISTILSLKL